MPEKRFFASIHLLRPLACVLGAGLLIASSSPSAAASQKIGYDPMVDGNLGQDLSLLGSAFYVPFTFNFDGDPYALDSIQLFLTGRGDVSSLSVLVTSTLGTDITLPSSLATYSAAGPLSLPSIFTFHADSPAVLNSGETYYLRMSPMVGGSDPQWVSALSLSGDPPADSGPPTSGPPSGGAPPVTLSPLMTLNPGSGLTFRQVGGPGGYTDRSGFYGISLTANAVPEPGAFALVIVGLTLTAALCFRLRRRHES